MLKKSKGKYMNNIMVQLIDKAALRKELSKLQSEMGFVMKSDVMQILGSQKCAYNIDKVVEQLDELRKECKDPLLDYDPNYFIDKAIDIAKGGGVND